MKLHTDDRIISRQSNWVFDEHVAPEFDKHVRKSVPNYVHVQELAETFSDWFTYPNSTVIDFGASTGETLRRIKRRHSKALNIIGYDNSQAMINQAKLKGIDITFADLEKPLDFPNISYAVSLYTLQFLRPYARNALLKRIYHCLENCGGMFVVEKVLGSTAQMQDILQQLYWEMKAKNGFSSEQIINYAAVCTRKPLPTTRRNLNQSALIRK